MIEKNIIYEGHSLSILKTLPDKLVDMCVTSPPYWGLRNYGTEYEIWDGNSDCSHEWGKPIEPKFNKPNQGVGSSTLSISKELNKTADKKWDSSFCILCGAWKGELGLEPTPELYIKHLTDIFREVKRVLKDDGTLWLNIGDTYAGGGRAGKNPEYHKKHTMFNKSNWNESILSLPQDIPESMKSKDLVGIPWMLAFSLRADGWFLRQDIIWSKPNPMPESVTDRCTKSHEYIFLLSKSKYYYYDYEAIKEPAKNWGIRDRKNFRGGTTDPKLKHYGLKNGNFKEIGRNKRSVWTVNTKPYKEAHFATFPEKLIRPIIKAGCKEDGIVLDPFFGSGTTGVVAMKLNKYYIGIEKKKKYIEMANKRLNTAILPLY